jgi:signal transduction histidine kinase/ActR/RegA family two-component response regulator
MEYTEDIVTPIDEYIVNFLKIMVTKDDIKPDDIQKLLDDCRDKLKVDAVCVVEMLISEDGFVFSYESCSDRKYRKLGKTYRMPKGKYDKIAEEYSTNRLISGPIITLGDEDLSILHYGIMERGQHEGTVAIIDYHTQNRRWTNKECCAVEKLGRVLRHIVEYDKMRKIDAERMRQREILKRQDKQLEDALAEAKQANQAKTAFLSNMSHDIRTPMNAIIGFSTLALDNPSDTEAVTDNLQKILMSGNHLLKLINDILDMSRIESGKVHIQEKECSLTDVMDSISSMILPQMTAKQLQFNCIEDIENSEVYADSLKIEQVLINILGNAVKFTPAGGSIDFKVTQEKCSMEGYAEYIFSIKDTGCGISEKFLRRIFEPFERENTAVKLGIEGTGLGMTITKNIVDMMKGTITVNSKLGKGTEFVIHLKLRLSEEQQPKKTQTRNRVERKKRSREQFKGKRLLVVEDNKLNREIAQKILTSVGFIIDSRGDGTDAVQAVKSSEENYYDAILMDIRMPVMDGHEATREIRALDRNDIKEMPIIAMTANAFEEDREMALKCGMTEHITKPLDIDKLFEILEKYIKSA